MKQAQVTTYPLADIPLAAGLLYEHAVHVQRIVAVWPDGWFRWEFRDHPTLPRFNAHISYTWTSKARVLSDDEVTP